MRRSGILLPVSSLPSQYGIGCFSKEAYEFVDFLAQAGQSYWQVLPMGPTGYGDSPYQSFSTFAGNPYFVDIEEFVAEKWITKRACDSVDWGSDLSHTDYEKVYKNRFKLLKKAYLKSDIENDKDFKKFEVNNSAWLNDYAAFMALKAKFNGKSFNQWPEEYKKHNKSALKQLMSEPSYHNEVMCYKFIQYYFFRQWSRLKKYANEKGVEIIGDIPLYVACDSADVWAHPELFRLDKNNDPTGVAGCPPDYFCATGQLWGNPLYDWEYMKKTGYKWWIERLKNCFELYDVVRIDHFRGFDEYYNIPYGDPTAEFGHWEKGPGYDFFRVVKDKLGNRKIIAEDLGFLTPSVFRLKKKTGFPGMKILEFAFDSGEDNDYLPHNYEKNCVVYTGTHDNDTAVGWFEKAGKRDREFVKEYMGIKNGRNFAWELIRLAQMSVADTVVIPLQDYLGLGSEARINTPSTLGGNWAWRMGSGACTEELAERIRKLSSMYGRVRDK
ncbi:MAG: 4-alpha-glucanotransferase [Lachnospiraceae bacterium]|nr:4-alpha-glucanotransferase [Lachnospiraceae bacterium]